MDTSPFFLRPSPFSSSSTIIFLSLLPLRFPLPASSSPGQPIVRPFCSPASNYHSIRAALCGPHLSLPVVGGGTEGHTTKTRATPAFDSVPSSLHTCSLHPLSLHPSIHASLHHRALRPEGEKYICCSQLELIDISAMMDASVCGSKLLS